MSGQITREEYLDKNFDYTKLTKQELRQIMSENNIQEIPPLTSLKSVIIDAYKTSVHDRIDWLKRNFSQENIFQASASNDEFQESPQKSRAGDLHSMIESSLVTDSKNKSSVDDTRANGENKSLNNENGRARVGAIPRKDRAAHPDESFNDSFMSVHSSRIGSSFNGQNSVVDPSESVLNDTTIALNPISAKENDGLKEPAAAPSLKSPLDRTQTPRRLFKKRHLFLALVVSLLVYLKLFCPYCTRDGKRLCVPLPTHSYLVDNQLRCERGYRIAHGIITHCVVDDSEHIKNVKKADKIIQILEYAKGEHRYNAKSVHRLRLVHLTSDAEVIALLRRSEKLSFAGDFVEARDGRVSFRVFSRFYLFRTVKILIPLVLGVFLIKVYIGRKRRHALMMKQANAIAKDVLDILSRQFIASTKSAVFRTYVYEVQLRDALDVKGALWGCVKQIIQQNSNVECKTDATGKATWEWVGPILSANDGHDFK